MGAAELEARSRARRAEKKLGAEITRQRQRGAMLTSSCCREDERLKGTAAAGMRVRRRRTLEGACLRRCSDDFSAALLSPARAGQLSEAWARPMMQSQAASTLSADSLSNREIAIVRRLSARAHSRSSSSPSACSVSAADVQRAVLPVNLNTGRPALN